MNLSWRFVAILVIVPIGLVAGCTASRFGNSHLEQEGLIDLSCEGCNVVFLNIDLLRANYVGLLNQKRKITPNIDRFFNESVIFQDVSSSSGVTAISNMSTLTGRDGAFTHTLLKNTYVDDPPQLPYRHLELYAQLPTIAEVLLANQYETINLNHGWYAGKQMLLHRGFDQYWGSGEVGDTENIPAKVIKQTKVIIQARSKKQKKFFLLMRSEDLRGLPYRYPKNRSRIDNPRIQYRTINPNYFEIYYQTTSDGKLTVKFPSRAKVNWMSDSEVNEYQKLSHSLYAQQLAYIDEELGNIFSALEYGSLLDKTIVVLYANHGDGLYDNRVPNHGVSYQSCVSVPLLIRHPKIKKQIRIQKPIALIDLVPTIYKMVNVKSPRDIDGKNIFGDLGRIVSDHPFLYGVDKDSRYLRVGAMKLIAWADGTKELYNLAKDPGELSNLAYEQPETVNRLYSRMINHEIEQLDRALEVLNNN